MHHVTHAPSPLPEQAAVVFTTAINSLDDALAAEPRLRILLADARRACGRDGNHWPRWGALKRRLRPLVGPAACHPALRSQALLDWLEREVLDALKGPREHHGSRRFAGRRGNVS